MSIGRSGTGGSAMAMTNLRNSLQRQRILSEDGQTVTMAGVAGVTVVSASPLSGGAARSSAGGARNLIITRSGVNGTGVSNSGHVTVTSNSTGGATLALLGQPPVANVARGLENPTRFHLEQQAKKSSPLVQQLLSSSSVSTGSNARPPGFQASLSSPSGTAEDPLSPNSAAGSDFEPDPMFGQELTLEQVEDFDWNLLEPTLNQLSQTVPTTTGGDSMFPVTGSGLTANIDSSGAITVDGSIATTIQGVTTGQIVLHGPKPSTSAPAKIPMAMRSAAAHAVKSAAVAAAAAAEGTAAASSGSASATQGLPPALSEEDLVAWQRDRFKKDSHNRIERKRRENINHQIAELGDILPHSCFRESEMKKNKGNILKASVEFIKELSLREEARRKTELENEHLRQKVMEYETLLRGLGLPLEGGLTSVTPSRQPPIQIPSTQPPSQHIKTEPSPNDVELMDAVNAVAAAAASGTNGWSRRQDSPSQMEDEPMDFMS